MGGRWLPLAVEEPGMCVRYLQMYQSTSLLEMRTHGTAEQERRAHEAMHNVHVGRGGAGNFRSPSREPADRLHREKDEIETQAQEDYLQQHEFQNQVHARGRGGAGNILAYEERGRSSSLPRVGSMIRSISRSRSREPRRARAEAAASPHRQLEQLSEKQEETASVAGTL